MSKSNDIPAGYELMSEPKLISDLTPAERKKIGRKVLNSTLKNAPEGTKIYGSGDMILPDGSMAVRTGHGRGRKAQYDFVPPEGYEVVQEPSQADEEVYQQSVDDVRKVRKEENKERYDNYKERMLEDGVDMEADTGVQEPTGETLEVEPESEVNQGENEPVYAFDLPRGWELFKGTHPGVQSAVDAVNSVGKVIDQGQPIDALQDGAMGIMSGLAETAGDIADVGGLVPNAVANAAHDSADWWKDQYEIIDSEAGNIGTNVGSEAVAGAAGGVVGKVAGTLYKGLKHSGEALRKRATVAAKEVEKRSELLGQSPLEQAIARQKAYENATAVPPRHSFTKAFVGDAQPQAGSVRIDPIPYTPALTKEDLITKVVRERNHQQGKYADGRGMTGTDLMDPVGRGNLEYPTFSRLADTAGQNMKRVYSDAAMLKRNDVELDQLFSQGNALDEALKMRQDRWDGLPNAGQSIGTALGLGAAAQ